jgi:predicted nucleic acid-binding Zn ribbon protein
VTARRFPRRAGLALRDVLAERAPNTLLARVQALWGETCGPAIAAESQPVAERDGVITVACRSATWAAELDLMQEELRERLNGALGGDAVKGLRFTADGARHGLGK